jgi:hypothetical protein
LLRPVFFANASRRCSMSSGKRRASILSNLQ